jgi:outer membrane protein assembly factor BamD
MNRGQNWNKKMLIQPNYITKLASIEQQRVAFEQIIRKYPDSKSVDYYLYMIIDASYKYAKNSIPSKQEQRYADVQAEYNNFIRKFPKSQFRSEIEKINVLSSRALKKLSKL